MFRPDDKTIIPEPTPERVYQCALYLQKQNKGIKKDEFTKNMTMSDVFGDKDNKSIFGYAYGVLRELDLAVETDGLIYPSEALSRIKTAAEFRKHCAKTIFQWENSLFSQVTSMYCQYAEQILKGQKWEDTVSFMGSQGLQFHANVMKGWRLWAPFLGCGYLCEPHMIPNWAVRISDLIKDQDEFEKNQDIPIETFIAWLTFQAPEVRNSIEGKKIGLGVSNGLNTLDELKMIKVISLPDAVQWQMVTANGLGSISHVRILGVK